MARSEIGGKEHRYAVTVDGVPAGGAYYRSRVDGATGVVPVVNVELERVHEQLELGLVLGQERSHCPNQSLRSLTCLLIFLIDA